MHRLLVQIGARFGLGAEETAPSLTEAQLDSFGYTATTYLDTYVNQIEALAAAAPNVRYFWHFNYVSRNGKDAAA